MTAPKPHDPHAARVTLDDVDKRINEILEEAPGDLVAEAEQLERAHQVLSDALQNRR